MAHVYHTECLGVFVTDNLARMALIDQHQKGVIGIRYYIKEVDLNTGRLVRESIVFDYADTHRGEDQCD